MVHVNRLRFDYGDGDFRLVVPSLAVERGETVAVVGPSGSGKTTLLNLLAGIALPAVGTVSADGVELSSLDDARRRAFRIARIGLVFQEFELLDYLSVLDNILLPYRITGSLRADDEVASRAGALAGQVGIGDKLRRDVNRLSQGERQRVAVCRALLPRPPLLLADEPTGNLDPVNRDRVLDFLFGYVVEHQATLIAVTHDRDLLGRFSRVIDMKALAPQAAAT